MTTQLDESQHKHLKRMFVLLEDVLDENIWSLVPNERLDDDDYVQAIRSQAMNHIVDHFNRLIGTTGN